VTWKRLPSDLPGSAFGGYGAGPEPASFRDTGEGWLGAGYLDSPTVYLTIDGAVTWRAVAIPPPASANNPGYLTTVSVAPGGQVDTQLARHDLGPGPPLEDGQRAQPQTKLTWKSAWKRGSTQLLRVPARCAPWR